MRTMLHCLSALLLVGLSAMPPARAADYPTKPIRIIVGYLPGAATDFSARVVAQGLSANLGQSVVVENRPGAASVLAVQYVSHAPPDGYTLLWGNADALTILPAVKPTVPYKMPDALTCISRTAQYPLAIGVLSSLPIHSLPDFVAYAKAHPGALKYGSSGTGGALHVAGMLFAQQAGIDLTHVPYNGASAAVTDLLGGFTNATFMTLSTIGPSAKDGKVRLLAVTSPSREALWPDLPTVAESGYPGATVVGWFGLFGPPGLPPEITARLSKAVAEVLDTPEVKNRLSTSVLDPAPLAGSAFCKFVVDDLARWKAVAQSAHIRIPD